MSSNIATSVSIEEPAICEDLDLHVAVFMYAGNQEQKSLKKIYKLRIELGIQTELTVPTYCRNFSIF